MTTPPTNEFTRIFEAYPDGMNGHRWIMELVSKNPNITMEYIDAHPEIAWNWIGVLANPSLTMADIERLIVNGLFDTLSLSEHPNLTLEFISTNLHRLNIPILSKHPAVTMEFIEAHMDLNWDFDLLASNPNITIDFIRRHPSISWNWWWLSMNPGITPKMIEANPDLPWSWMGISMNTNLYIGFIRRNLDKKWDWSSLSNNIAIPVDVILKHPDLPWRYDELLNNPTIEERHVLNVIELAYEANGYYPSMAGLVIRPNISAKYILHLHTESVFTLTQYELNWIHQNPTITLEILQDLTKLLDPDGIIFDTLYLSENPFKYNVLSKHKKQQFELLGRAVVPLQKRFLEHYWNPKYELCQRRLMRELYEMNDMIDSVRNGIKHL